MNFLLYTYIHIVQKSLFVFVDRRHRLRIFHQDEEEQQRQSNRTSYGQHRSESVSKRENNRLLIIIYRTINVNIN